MYVEARKKLIQVIRELKLPYDIDTLCTIRRECFTFNMKHQKEQKSVQLHLKPQPKPKQEATQRVQLQTTQIILHSQENGQLVQTLTPITAGNDLDQQILNIEGVSPDLETSIPMYLITANEPITIEIPSEVVLADAPRAIDEVSNGTFVCF